MKEAHIGLCSVTNPPCCVLTETLESDFFPHLVVIVNGVIGFLLCFFFFTFFFSKVHGYLQYKYRFYHVILKHMLLLLGMKDFSDSLWNARASISQHKTCLVDEFLALGLHYFCH